MEANRRIAILGAGPAGLSAALWLHNLGFQPLVLEATGCAGGLQNLNFLGNNWVLGQPGLTGPQLTERFLDHARSAGVAIRLGAEVRHLAGAPGAFQLSLGNDETMACAAVVIATGTRYRAAEVLAGVTGIAAVAPEHIAYGPYAFADLEGCRGKRVLVIGGGDNAFENVRLLLPQAAQITLAIRSRPRAQRALVDDVTAAQAAGRCRLLRGATPTSVSAREDGLNVAFNGHTETITVDRVHVLAGYEPNTRFLRERLAPELCAALRFDERDYLLADSAGRCAAGLYAAGDVCNPAFPSVVSAIAQGAAVAKTIELDFRTP